MTNFRTQKNFPTSPDVFSDRVDFINNVVAADVNSLADSLVDTQTKVIENTDGYLSREPSLGNPSEDGYALSSSTGGVRSWVNKEDNLGKPSVDGYVLISTTGGVRSWIEKPTRPEAHPTTMTNVVATRMGYYEYYHNGAYNSGGAPVITLQDPVLATFDVRMGLFIPYQSRDGTWRMKFNIAFESTLDDYIIFTIDGIVFKNDNSTRQAVAYTANNSLAGYSLRLSSAYTYQWSSVWNAIRTAPDNGNDSVNHSFYGDVELVTKPTWAY